MNNELYLVVAFSSEVSPEAPVPAFSAPATYKDPAKIAAYVRAKEEAYRAGAARLDPLGMRLTGFGAAVYGGAGEPAAVVLEGDDLKAVGAAGVFQAMEGLVPAANRWSAACPPEATPVLVGFDVRALIRHLGLRAAIDRAPVPLSFWQGNTRHIEAARLLTVGSTGGTAVSLAEAYQAAVGAGDPWPAELHADGDVETELGAAAALARLVGCHGG